MAHYIGKIEDEYFVYSTVVDAPITPLTSLVVLEKVYNEPVTPERVERLKAKGTSAIDKESLEDMIAYNRYGENEATLPFDEFVRKLKHESL